MNDPKILQYSEYAEEYESNTVLDEELTNWKSHEVPSVQGTIYKDTSGSNARFLLSLPGMPVMLFSSPDVVKGYLFKVRRKSEQRNSAKKSSYYGLVGNESEFIASLEHTPNQLANRLEISPSLLDYSVRSVHEISKRLKEMPMSHDLYDGEDSTFFLIIKYIGAVIYKNRGEAWAFRKQEKYDVKIPASVLVGKGSQSYDWFAAVTSTTVERRFDQYIYVVETAVSK